MLDKKKDSEYSPKFALKQALSSFKLWEDYLCVMAEHPGMSAYNLAKLTIYRNKYDLHDTTNLYAYDTEQAKGNFKAVSDYEGYVKKGAAAVTLSFPRFEREKDGKNTFKGFDSINLFPEAMCEGLKTPKWEKDAAGTWVQNGYKLDKDGNILKPFGHRAPHISKKFKGFFSEGINAIDATAVYVLKQRYECVGPDTSVPSSIPGGLDSGCLTLEAGREEMSSF